MLTAEERALFARVRQSPFGCLAPGCPVTTSTYAEIDEHITTEHPEIP